MSTTRILRQNGTVGTVTDDDIAELVRRAEEATAAYAQDDMKRYVALVNHADPYTLADPFGGPAAQYEHRAGELEDGSSAFTSGEAQLELLHVHAWDETVVLVAVERQHGEVGNLPDQDWSLRVTLVFRRAGADWELIHRHADPLVHAIGLDRLAALARGE
jgi:ketosteroid isomerase-like protein